jgi:V/A-type H+-transporting ATPase subunit A
LREIAGRLEEMPGEEGYPAYLARKVAEFYERAGKVDCLGTRPREGSVSAVGAVSPPGGDISEPVSQTTLRITKVFWALDSSLARRRHYPAINWLKSYSLYQAQLENWYGEKVAPDFMTLRNRAMALLQQEAELQNIVQLIGPDALPEKERLVLDAAKMIREDFLQQFAFDPVDASNSLKKQYLMLKTVMSYYDQASAALAGETPLEKIVSVKEKEQIAQLKRVPENQVERKCAEIIESLEKTFAKA